MWWAACEAAHHVIAPVQRRQSASPLQYDAMNFKEKPSMLVLAIYLILVGLTQVAGATLGAAGMVLPILALVAGVMILLGR